MPPDYDVTGYADDIMGGEGDILGAVTRAVQSRMQRGGQRPIGRQRPLAMPPLPINQVAPEAKVRTPVGAGIAVWGAADASDKPLTIEPQSSFRAERLVIEVLAVGGTSAGLVLVRDMRVGNNPQSPSSEQPMPASMFRADATYASMALEVANRACKLTALLGITAAPGAGVTVTAAAGWYGEWIK